MSERTRIIIVLLFVAGYLFIDQRLINHGTGITVLKVIIALLISIIVYSGLVLLFSKKHRH